MPVELKNVRLHRRSILSGLIRLFSQNRLPFQALDQNTDRPLLHLRMAVRAFRGQSVGAGRVPRFGVLCAVACSSSGSESMKAAKGTQPSTRLAVQCRDSKT
jgi:hypothetical protein